MQNENKQKLRESVVKRASHFKQERENCYLIKIKENLRKFYSGQLGLSNVEERIRQRICRERGQYYIARFANWIDLKNKKLLDVGSGWGEHLAETHKRGAIVYGIEPDDELLEIIDLLLKSEKISENTTIKKGYAEKIPFEDNFFDIVICIHVLEHVYDVKKSIKEMIRVLKKGGHLYLACPNYLYPQEGHYKIKWFPLMPKFLGKVYLRLKGRNPNFLTSINYVTFWSLFYELKKYNLTIRNIGVEELVSKLKEKTTLKRVVWKMMIFFHLYPEIELLIKKLG